VHAASLTICQCEDWRHFRLLAECTYSTIVVHRCIWPCSLVHARCKQQCERERAAHREHNSSDTRASSSACMASCVHGAVSAAAFALHCACIHFLCVAAARYVLRCVLSLQYIVMIGSVVYISSECELLQAASHTTHTAFNL
jgi:hypothetical protein